MTDDELLEKYNLREYIAKGNHSIEICLSEPVEIFDHMNHVSTREFQKKSRVINLTKKYGIQYRCKDLLYVQVSCSLYRSEIALLEPDGWEIKRVSVSNNFRSYRQIINGLETLNDLIEAYFGGESNYIKAYGRELFEYIIKYLEK